VEQLGEAGLTSAEVKWSQQWVLMHAVVCYMSLCAVR